MYHIVEFQNHKKPYENHKSNHDFQSKYRLNIIILAKNSFQEINQANYFKFNY